MNKKILILYSSLGSGHKIAADAIEEGLNETIGNVKVVKEDIISHSLVKIDPLSKINVRNRPAGNIYDYLWRKENLAKISQKTIALLRDNFSSIEKLINSLNPDAIVCTQAAGSVIVSSLNKNGLLNIPHIAVLTDFRTVPLWPTKGVDLYCASTFPSMTDLLKRGLQRNRVIVTGIPLRKQFLVKNTNKTINSGPIKVLLVSGGIQSTPYSSVESKVIELISDISSLNIRTTIVCGVNEKLNNKLDNFIKRKHLLKKYITHGYTDKMATLISRNDVVITKPGGLICSESIALGKPLILIGGGYGQEKGNVEYLINHGAAMESRKIDKVGSILNILQDRKMLKRMSNNSKRIAQNNSTRKIVKEILKLTKIS